VACSVKIRASPAKALAKINKPDRAQLCEAIDRLATRPQTGSTLKGDRKGLRRLRVGKYRVIYELLERELVVLVVHRPDPYGR
jgi:mRNA interferase RelE/StbE